ncbi:MAG: SPFH domain-containing protein [Prevotella sp.]|nr:SPFH domain-containing protein [Prevotella sp.]
MGLFGRGKGGGLMNVIRCDQQEYIVWKWRPGGQEANSTSRENAIRWNSSLRVKDGEVAVFVYQQKNGMLQDFIVGPYDDMLKTKNFPVLTNIVGTLWGGDSPFQAEVYFINLQQNNQLRFGVPYFDVFDPRLPDQGVPVAVRGTLTFNITDYEGFIKLNRLQNFNHDDFKRQINAAISKHVRQVVTNMPMEAGIPLIQLERQIETVSDSVQAKLAQRLSDDFGVNLKVLDISTVEIDKTSPYYQEVYRLTAGLQAQTLEAQAQVNIKNLHDTQELNRKNMEETMRIQREEAQRAQRLKTETQFIGAHALDQQASVLRAGAESLGQMGQMGGGGDGSGGGGMNAAGMMAGMMMGGAMGQQMAGMMNNMGQYMQQGMQAGQQQINQQLGTTPPPMPGAATPPPMPNVQYFVSIGGQQAGPFASQQMAQLVQNGSLTPQTYVWRQGMAAWELAQNMPELAFAFAPQQPPAPPAGAPMPPPMP